ncbi:carboxypeptidase-like regulatory domain-containing protein [Algibacter luteus]|uniref:carboxypeptidase-like regulatory domain-containing protein n=1 Tax=Algibacter luteus TaxID=1178825 RepID=UPI002593FC2F|nr:carboxypeptidase-like regulatory domain-containing protein [Algibacter luteus]WJJ96850.1 carboxypeptidase-like regulatory domain-containing protein [Algibacter luteus]
MKHILTITLILLSAVAFAQSTGSVNGNLLDFESNNEPLIFAKVKIKETGAEILCDEKGFFKFENLNEGTYTIVSSFTGYQTKETKITIASHNTTSVNIILEADTISLEDLVSVMASADNQTKSTALNN